ncbi:unnamed protein product [Amaranthus hypochondriacus]
MYLPLLIFSKQSPFGVASVSEVLVNNLMGLPSKHTTSSTEVLPKTSQNVFSDCQSSVNVEELEVNGAPPFKEGSKGEFGMDTSLHVFHTVEQKLGTDWVELHRRGTGCCCCFPVLTPKRPAA